MTQRDSHGVRGRLSGELGAQHRCLRLDSLGADVAESCDIVAAESMGEIPERIQLDLRQLLDAPGRPLTHEGRVNLGLALVLGLTMWALLALIGYAVWTLT